MSEYRLVGVENADFSKDRADLSIVFRTDRGLITLRLAATHLDQLIAVLGEIESTAALLDPVEGPSHGEHVSRRVSLADGGEVEAGNVDGRPALLFGFRTGKITRWFAVHPSQAEGLRNAIDTEISKLGRPAGVH